MTAAERCAEQAEKWLAKAEDVLTRRDDLARAGVYARIGHGYAALATAHTAIHRSAQVVLR